MIPIFLDPAAARVAVIGDGPLALRRLTWLREFGADVDVWSEAPSPALTAAAGASLTSRLPSRAELACYHAIWIADLAVHEAEALASLARRVRVLVNVEDKIALCAFHTPAVVRRGKLTLAAGTGGASPAVAKAARERMEQAFSQDWEHALDEIAQSRTALRAQKAGFDELVADARLRLAQHGI